MQEVSLFCIYMVSEVSDNAMLVQWQKTGGGITHDYWVQWLIPPCFHVTYWFCCWSMTHQGAQHPNHISDTLQERGVLDTGERCGSFWSKGGVGKVRDNVWKCLHVCHINSIISVHPQGKYLKFILLCTHFHRHVSFERKTWLKHL